MAVWPLMAKASPEYCGSPGKEGNWPPPVPPVMVVAGCRLRVLMLIGGSSRVGETEPSAVGLHCPSWPLWKRKSTRGRRFVEAICTSFEEEMRSGDSA